MEWKTIRNAGHIHSQAELPKDKRFAVAAEFLEGVVEEFARASYRYCELINELPFIYRERQIHSVLLPAIAKIATASLVEMPIIRNKEHSASHRNKDRSASHGWIDYWVCYQEIDLLIEVKHSWQAVASSKLRETTTSAWSDLSEQLYSLSPETVDYTLSRQPLKVALLIMPCYRGSKNYPGDEPFDQSITTDLHDLIKNSLNNPTPNWSSIWRLHHELQEPFLYDDWYERYPCVIFMASVLKFE